MKLQCLYYDIDIRKEMSIYLVLQPPLSFSIPSQYNRENKESETLHAWESSLEGK